MKRKQLLKLITLSLALVSVVQVSTVAPSNIAGKLGFIESAYASESITYSVNSLKGQAYSYDTRWGI